MGIHTSVGRAISLKTRVATKAYEHGLTKKQLSIPRKKVADKIRSLRKERGIKGAHKYLTDNAHYDRSKLNKYR